MITGQGWSFSTYLCEEMGRRLVYSIAKAYGIGIGIQNCSDSANSDHISIYTNSIIHSQTTL